MRASIVSSDEEESGNDTLSKPSTSDAPKARLVSTSGPMKSSASAHRPTPGYQAPQRVNNDSSLCGHNSDTGAIDGPKYYNVMWCKMSKKKHKTWEEDGKLGLGLSTLWVTK